MEHKSETNSVQEEADDSYKEDEFASRRSNTSKAKSDSEYSAPDEQDLALPKSNRSSEEQKNLSDLDEDNIDLAPPTQALHKAPASKQLLNHEE